MTTKQKKDRKKTRPERKLMFQALCAKIQTFGKKTDYHKAIGDAIGLYPQSVRAYLSPTMPQAPSIHAIKRLEEAIKLAAEQQQKQKQGASES